MWPFGKKKDDIEELEKELGLGGEERLGLDTPKEEAYDNLNEPLPEKPDLNEPAGIDSARTLEPEKNTTPIQTTNTDLQLISAKLDTLKVMLESITQRLEHLEKKEEKHKMWQ